MRMTVNFSMFCDAFKQCDRQDQFSYAGKKALFVYLEEMDENYELDIITLCCEFQEFESFDEVRDQYNDCAEMNDSGVLEWLRDNTSVISDEPILIQAF